MSNHTPGKWKATRIGGSHRGSHERGMAMRIEAPEANTSKRRDIGVIYNKPDWEEAQANAALFAASPEMLEVLEYAAELVKTARQYFPKSIQNSDRFDLENINAAITKAIAKAKGQTP